MDLHDPKRIATGRGRQNWRAFRPIAHLHENYYTKRAGVAGIRARGNNSITNICSRQDRCFQTFVWPFFAGS
ncbi:TPA: hypothetical protein G9E81_003145 [Salmonella enterica]|uniref:Uncharacterized protein n=1 Tax=Salmonella enterica TaxID=28901 RepID=A0A743U3R9_SALER|nr:hypothetical protein [Salmonella enterica]HAF2210468.1 hypothetical protein [Salmonella enterica]